MSIKGLFADFRDFLTMRQEEQVRDFVENFDWGLIQRNLEPKTIPGAKHIAGLAGQTSGQAQRMVKSVEDNLALLNWGQSYTAADFGQEFIDNYGFVELMGQRGHFQCEDMAGGFSLLGPNQHYPSHHHVAEALYMPLTNGSYWMLDGGSFEEKQACEIIFCESNESYAIETPDSPLLSLYLWRGGDLMQKPNY